MQVLSKVKQQPTSPSTINSNITPQNRKDLVQTITKLLENGQESAHQLKIIIDNNQGLGFKVEDDVHHVIDHHSRVTLNAFDKCLSLLNNFDFDHHSEKVINNNKRKIDAINDVQCHDHDDHHDHGGHDHHDRDGHDHHDSSNAKVSKEKRGCYKRRRIGQTRTMETTNLIDDGHAWRKYGQKDILNTKYPRNYFRCTYKLSQGCQAIKQVQKISENPTKYMINYHGQHTCENLHKNSSIIIEDNPPLENSSFMLNFDSNIYPTPKHALINSSSLFPPSSMVNHDHHSCGPHKQYSSLSSSSTSDITSTTGLLPSTPVSSEQSDVISPPEVYSSASTPYDDMDEALRLIIMDQLPILDGLF